jgi:hypothetical protein
MHIITTHTAWLDAVSSAVPNPSNPVEILKKVETTTFIRHLS